MEHQATQKAKDPSGGTHEYLFTLMKEVQATDPEALAPVGPVEEGEKVLGQVDSEHVRKLYSAAMISRKELDLLELDHKYAGPHEENVPCPFAPKMLMAKYRSDLLLEMFWACVNHDQGFPSTNIGIRKGWKIVVPSEPGSSLKSGILDLLKSLRGEADAPSSRQAGGRPN